MRRYKSVDHFNIPGRGIVYPVDMKFNNVMPEVGEEVELDGKIVTVKGVEYRKTAMDPPKLIDFAICT